MQLQSQHYPSGGFSLLETLITLGLTTLLFMVMISFFSVSVLKNHSRFTVQASAIAASELEGARSIPFVTIANRTNAPFFTHLYTVGDWSVLADGSNQVVSVTSSGSSGVTGQIRVPTDGQSDYELLADVTVPPGAPAGWAAGLVSRGQETDRYYRFTVQSNAAVLEKVEPSGATVLNSTPYALSPGTTVALKVVTSGDNFELWAGGANLATVSDATAGWSSGDSGLIVLNGATAYFDNVTVNAVLVADGDFESVATGTLPASWDFLQPRSLPNGTAQITIADYGGDNHIKRLTAIVTWLEQNRTRSLTMESLRSQ